MARRQKGPRLHLRRAYGTRSAHWIVKDGPKRISTGCAPEDLEAAKEFFAEYLAATHMPPPGARRPSQIQILEVLLVYRREKEPKLARPDMVAYAIPHLVDFWGDDCLNDITAARCRAYVKWRCQQGKGCSDQTARRDLETLRAAIKHFHEEHGPLDAVPVVKLPAKSEARQRALERGEAARLLKAAKSPHLRRFILIGLYTGMRSQAILSLSWLPSTATGWVDLDKGILYRRGEAVRKTKKTQNQKPSTIPTRLLAHLRRWHRMDMKIGTPFVVHYHGSKVAKLRRSWGNARDAAGLGTDVIPHVLRHTAATWLMRSGVDKWEAAGYLGMSMEMLDNVYGHHHPDHQSGVKNAFGTVNRGGPK